MKIKKGDKVQIITGKDAAAKKTGTVEMVDREAGRLLVGGVNIVTRNQKGSGSKPGGLIKKPAPIDASNVMLVCPKCTLPTRVGYQVSEKGKQRICKKCKKLID